MGEKTREWYDVTGKLKDKAKEFQVAYEKLTGSASAVEKNPALKAERVALLNKGNIIRTKVLEITGSIDSAYTWLKSSVGLSGLSQDSGLGILPMIPIAIAAASVAAMTKFISDTYIYLDKVQKFDVLEKKYGAERAANIVARLAPSGNFMELLTSRLIPIVVIGGGLIYLLKRRV